MGQDSVPGDCAVIRSIEVPLPRRVGSGMQVALLPSIDLLLKYCTLHMCAVTVRTANAQLMTARAIASLYTTLH